MGGAGGTARARGTLSHVPLGSSTACCVGLVLGRVTSATSSTCRSQALCTLHCCSSTGAVLVQAGGSAKDRESLPVLAGALGPGWEPLQSPARVSATPAVGSQRQNLGKVLADTARQCSERTGGLEAVGTKGQTGTKEAPKTAVSTDPLGKQRGHGWCAGQSQRCRVLGEETLDTGRTAAEGTVYHVPWM